MFLLHSGPARDGLMQKFREAGALSSDDCSQLSSWHAQLISVYPRADEDMVSSHNDLFKPDNTLFDGERIWLVDWEAAFLNDRYADLAAVANQLVANEEQEMVFLRAYFRAGPDAFQVARFHLMRQVAHLFYTMAFLSAGSSGEPIDWSGTVPEFSDYQRRMWTGEVDLSDNDLKIAYGRVNWERLLHNVRQPRYYEALRIVSEGHRAAR
jgi:hypothetical protein